MEAFIDYSEMKPLTYVLAITIYTSTGEGQLPWGTVFVGFLYTMLHYFCGQQSVMALPWHERTKRFSRFTQNKLTQHHPLH
jgi:hypothetical protein